MKLGSSPEIEARIAELLAREDVHGAATEALRGYGPGIFVFLHTILRDRQAAEEVFARASEKLWAGIRSWRRESAFRTWAIRVAWNAAKDFKKEAFARRMRRLETTEISKIAAEVQSSIGGEALRLDQLAESLTLAERTLLELRVNEGLGWKQIAKVMAEEGEPQEEAALRKRFERLKAKLHRLARGAAP